MRMIIPAIALGLTAFAGSNPALSQSGSPAPLPMQFGQRVQLGPMMGERIVREVMISQGGGGLTVIYDMAPDKPQSRRVVRLENVNGMLEVIHDDAMPSDMALGGGGAPRLVQGGGGMYSVEYDR